MKCETCNLIDLPSFAVCPDCPYKAEATRKDRKKQAQIGDITAALKKAEPEEVSVVHSFIRQFLG